MSTGFSQNTNNNFIDAVVQQDLLDVAVVWIGDNLAPDDVFSERILEEWAEDNGYRRRDD
jgi:hypothetical protein